MSEFGAVSWGSSLIYVAYILLIFRSIHYSGQVDSLWKNDPSREWNRGKMLHLVSMAGFFLLSATRRVTDPIFDAYPNARVIILLASLGLLLAGEWRIGTGFKWVVEAQGRMRRRHNKSKIKAL